MSKSECTAARRLRDKSDHVRDRVERERKRMLNDLSETGSEWKGEAGSTFKAAYQEELQELGCLGRKVELLTGRLAELATASLRAEAEAESERNRKLSGGGGITPPTYGRYRTGR